MSSHSQTLDHDGPVVYEQYEDIAQQQETYVVGMWAFLVTEIMMFGALFMIYTLYRWKFQGEFFIYHEHLRWDLAGLNTLNLLTSSWFMAKAVQCAQLGKKRAQLGFLWLTFICGGIFLVIKAFEWIPKFQGHLVPTDSFIWPPLDEPTMGGSPEHARTFFSLYFAMTGLHGVHVLIGMICLATLAIMVQKKAKVITDYIPTELVGLYWHLVDLVWIFLYPCFYLIPR